jgi:hypothetical protein
MSQNIQECSICMDDIDFKNNCITTECGHSFHASCLMRNVAHNGFGCPYCRNTLAEAVEDSDSEYSEEEEVEVFDDYALRGLRFFTNNLEGNEHEQEDVEEEAEDLALDAEAVEVEQVIKPSPAFITQKLVEQGVTMEMLVKALLKDHDEYDAEEEEFVRIDDELFGDLRIIISNYQPEQNLPLAQEVEQEQQPTTPTAHEVDYRAQPKQNANITTRRPMMHI